MGHPSICFQHGSYLIRKFTIDVDLLPSPGVLALGSRPDAGSPCLQILEFLSVLLGLKPQGESIVALSLTAVCCDRVRPHGHAP